MNGIPERTTARVAIAFAARRAAILAACLAGAGFLVPASPSVAAEEGGDATFSYAIEVTLAPVCVSGAFPLSIGTGDGAIEGVLDGHTEDDGSFTGTLTVGDRILAARGRVKFRASRSTLRLTAWAEDERITMKGTLTAAGFEGVARGEGGVAPGRNPFTLDLKDAPPSTAVIEVTVPSGTKGTLRGSGVARVVTDPVNVDATMKIGKSLSLTLRGAAFRWKGKGRTGVSPGATTVSWKAKGWGAVASGEGLSLEPITPP